MDFQDSFIAHRAEQLTAELTPPIDLQAIARACNVLSVEEREMIPEAAMAPESDGFRIYLQSNFLESPGAYVRQRFSLAHELAHTFFFERRDGKLTPVRGAPRGECLEAACHQGAGLLLVPERALRNELKNTPPPFGAATYARLAKCFEVSVEVIMRRLDKIGAFDGQFAPVLVRRQPNVGLAIEFAVYPPWLKALLPTPRRGMAFAAWFGIKSGQDGESSWRKETPQGILTATPVNVSTSSQVVELRIL